MSNINCVISVFIEYECEEWAKRISFKNTAWPSCVGFSVLNSFQIYKEAKSCSI